MAEITRRTLLGSLAAGAAAVGAAAISGKAAQAEATPAATRLKGRIKQTACRWCISGVSMDKLCTFCQDVGLKGIDLVDQKDWPTLKKYGLMCTMVSSHSIGKGFNHKENHDECVAAVKKSIDAAAEAGFPNVIAFSGNRGGLSDDAGAAACVEGFKKVAGYAEEKKITICMELLNSKRDHKDYQNDHTAWGAGICKKVGSPRMKLLYDIYHMQIMEGDIINTIRENFAYIGHVHTAGVPGRHELDDRQELNYPPIMRALVDLKYDGYVGQEFNPTRDPLESLKAAVMLCDV
jgi:hydroxypyruvate isomerase